MCQEGQKIHKGYFYDPWGLARSTSLNRKVLLTKVAQYVCLSDM